MGMKRSSLCSLLRCLPSTLASHTCLVPNPASML